MGDEPPQPEWLVSPRRNVVKCPERQRVVRSRGVWRQWSFWSHRAAVPPWGGARTSCASPHVRHVAATDHMAQGVPARHPERVVAVISGHFEPVSGMSGYARAAAATWAPDRGVVHHALVLTATTASLALLGTLAQCVLALQQLVTTDREATNTFNIGDEWLHEVSLRHPIRRWRQRRHVRRVLRDSTEESALFWRVRLTLLAWLLLLVAAMSALTPALQNA